MVKNVNFEPNFQHESEFLYFDKFHPSKIQSSKTSHIWAKFSTQIKFYGFCQISFFAGKFWAKFSRWLKVLDLAKFIFCRSHGVNLSILSRIFTVTENFWILLNFILCMFWVFKNVSFEPNFSTRLKISVFCHISSFAGPQWSKMSILSQIFNVTFNVRISPNFSLPRSRVVKN